jgi:energy-coupling factor transporter ATP-binding protein EcfA2
MSAATIESGALIDDIQRWQAELHDIGLRSEEEVADLKAELAQSRGERLDLPPDPILVVTLCGPTTAGKSTLINTLAGEEISSPGLGATTSSAVIYLHADDNPERLFEYGQDIGTLARTPHTVVRHRRPELLHKVLIDTPDIDSVVKGHREVTSVVVHSADLVLFVTTPERYRDMQVNQWVADQSVQRAMAFVLNKWDRASIGLQWDSRQLIEEDFRRVLRINGFQASQIFKVSCLKDSDGGSGGPASAENQLPELRDWLERGLSRSVSAAIQDRRRVMAWGRLSAAIARNIPTAIAGTPWVEQSSTTLANVRQQAKGLTRTAAAELTLQVGDRSVWPASPGVFGAYARLLAWGAAVRRAPWYNPFGLGQSGASDAADESAKTQPAFGVAEFGAPIARLFTEAVRSMRYDLIARPLPVEAVASRWDGELRRLPSRLASLPSATWAELLERASALSFRRFVGSAAIGAIELLIIAVLGMTLWHVGRGFVSGEYAPSGLLYSTAALVILLLLAGHVLANLFFPSLRRRFQADLTRRLESTVNQSCDAMENALSEHVATIDRLAGEGRDIERKIDGILHSLRQSTGGIAVDNLFAQTSAAAPATPRTPEPVAAPPPPTRRTARFE